MSGAPTAYRTALYMRLSKDDEGSGESSSITNQRNMLAAYAKEYGYPICAEYVDDGYSGTNFDRPAFQRMIQDIEHKKITLILTKDLSRLGRDYIQTGQYTEVYFPSKKVRYIAINDGFDSESQYTDIAPFKHVVNEMYARDTSKKIRSAFSIKMRGGSYIGNFAPYGYRKDPSDKNHLLPDETSAAVVQKIYSLAAGGAKPADIAHYLNAQKVLTPVLYRCWLHPQLDPDNYTQRREWTAATITKLLRSIVYLGHLAQGKTTKVSFKSKLTLRNALSDWIIVENTHEPIISAELFAQVQKRMESRTCEKKGRFCNIFSGIAKCAACGRNMSTVGTRRKGSPANLACGGYKLHGSGECSNHFIDYSVFYGVVLDAVRAHVRITPEERAALFQDLCAQLGAELDDEGRKSEPGHLRGELEKLDRIIEQLYDDNLSGKITEARFYKLLQKYEAQSAELQSQMTGLGASEDKEQDARARMASFDRLSELLTRYENLQELNAEALFALIDRIEVGQGWYEQEAHRRVKHQEIKIHFRFMTETQTMDLSSPAPL